MSRRQTRRQFVRRGRAAALVAASAPALLAGSAPAATTAQLRRRLRGALVTPRDPGWEAARALRNPRLDVEPRAIAALVAAIERWPGVGGRGHEGGVQLDALGGAVNRPAAGATAFVHRAQRMHCAYLSFWGRADPAPMAAACAQWVRDTQALLGSHASGFAFQNYIDPELTNWEQAYFGANLARLKAVKRRYDPNGRFVFAQGVSR